MERTRWQSAPERDTIQPAFELAPEIGSVRVNFRADADMFDVQSALVSSLAELKQSEDCGDTIDVNSVKAFGSVRRCGSRER